MVLSERGTGKDASIPSSGKRQFEAQLVLLVGFHHGHMVMSSLAMQQKETPASAEEELEDGGMSKQEVAERGHISSQCKAGEALQVFLDTKYICRVQLAKVQPRCWLAGGYGPWGRCPAHGMTSGPSQRERSKQHLLVS